MHTFDDRNGGMDMASLDCRPLAAHVVVKVFEDDCIGDSIAVVALAHLLEDDVKRCPKA